MLDADLPKSITLEGDGRRVIDLDRADCAERVIVIANGVRDDFAARVESSPAFDPVARCVVRVRDHEIVALPFLHHAAGCVISQLDPAIRIFCDDQVTTAIVRERLGADPAGLPRIRHALFYDTAKDIRFVVDRLPQRIDAAQELARRTVLVAPRLAPVINLFHDPSQRVTLQLIQFAALVHHANQPLLGVVPVFDHTAVRHQPLGDLPQRRIFELRDLAIRIAIARQVAAGVIAAKDLSPAGLDCPRQVAVTIVFVTAHLTQRVDGMNKICACIVRVPGEMPERVNDR
ncbi:hypothetical protein X941_4293 [Burkholderia pseudomallei MSHR5569]|nr:hypothetical protein X941_4293 [Burkholderia pseudomallei MSHR5569]